jgi:hypothetical protein
MSGLLPEQAVEVIDKAVILDRLDAISDVEAFPFYSGDEPVPLDFAGRGVGFIATVGSAEGHRIDLRGIINVEEAAGLYGVIRVTHPSAYEGGHLAVVEMGAYDGAPAKGLGIIHPEVGDMQFDTDGSQVAFSPDDRGRAAVSYHNAHNRNASMDVHMRPAGTGAIEMLRIPDGMWVPDPNTDKHMDWILHSRPSA